MRKKFPRDQKHGKDRCTELDPFLPSLFSSKRTHSPASRRVAAHSFCIPKKKKVDQCTDPGESQHWIPESVGMEAGGWSGGGGGNQCGKTKSGTYPTHKHCCCTDPLDYG